MSINNQMLLWLMNMIIDHKQACVAQSSVLYSIGLNAYRYRVYLTVVLRLSWPLISLIFYENVATVMKKLIKHLATCKIYKGRMETMAGEEVIKKQKSCSSCLASSAWVQTCSNVNFGEQNRILGCTGNLLSGQ